MIYVGGRKAGNYHYGENRSYISLLSTVWLVGRRVAGMITSQVLMDARSGTECKSCTTVTKEKWVTEGPPCYTWKDLPTRAFNRLNKVLHIAEFQNPLKHVFLQPAPHSITPGDGWRSSIQSVDLGLKTNCLVRMTHFSKAYSKA